jgi:hypothetical protein
VVSYAVAGDQILMRLPDYNDIVHYAPGSEVRIDVDGGTPAAHRETVVVTGKAALAGGDQKPLIDQTAFQEEWPPDVSTSVICLPLTAIEGFELRDP